MNLPLVFEQSLNGVQFGLILFFNEAVALIWGRFALFSSLPDWLKGHIDLFDGARFPVYRAAVIAVGLAVTLGLWFVITRTRLGVLVRAGASNRTMVDAPGRALSDARRLM